MKLTIFTPLYNRKDKVENLYQSLKKQSCYDFEWMIVDDGSTDHPEELIQKWQQEESLFDIVFISQANGGKHRAMNYGIEHAKGEYFFTCDSDDYLTDDAVPLIIEWLDEIKDDKNLFGVAGLKISPEGEFLLWQQEGESVRTCGGTPSFTGYVDATCDESISYGLFGDRCEVVRTDIMKNYLFPEFEGENFLTESVMWNRMSRDGIKLRWYDKATEVCEYQAGGLTDMGMKKFINNPKGYGLYIRENICREDERREQFYDYYDQLKSVLSEEEIMHNLGVESLDDIKSVGRERIEKRLKELELMEEVVHTKQNLKSAGNGLYEQMKPQLFELLRSGVQSKNECNAVMDGEDYIVLLAIEKEKNRLLEELSMESKMKSLKLYVVSSHVDKPIKEVINHSKYEIPIQAGAALTDKRICEVNDYDGFAESISNRNHRYSECSAIYWIGKHIDSDYVGIEHYRRRFACSDEQLEQWMDSDVDIITTKPLVLTESLKTTYINGHYGGDWVMMFDMLKRYDPENYEYYVTEAESKAIHFGNINIMRADVFKAYCEWVFPMVDEYYRNTPEKMDVYNCRDAGFFMERLTHFYIMRMIREGKNVVESEIEYYTKAEWKPEDECDLTDFDAVYEACNRLYENRRITQCCLLLGEAVKNGAEIDPRLKQYSDVLYGGILERLQSQITMYEYLPNEMKDTLEHLCDSFDQLRQIVALYASNPTDEIKQLFADYLAATGYSMILVNYILDNMG